MPLSGQGFPELDQRGHKPRSAFLKIRAEDFCRVACLRTRLIEVGIERDDRNANSPESAAGSHAVLSEAQHDGRRLIKTREIHFYS